MSKAGGHLRVAPSPRRAVILAEGDRWIRVCAGYAAERGLTVVCVCARIEDALYELVNGHADVLIVSHGYQLLPLIQIVAGAGPAEVPPSQRRTRRLQ